VHGRTCHRLRRHHARSASGACAPLVRALSDHDAWCCPVYAGADTIPVRRGAGSWTWTAVPSITCSSQRRAAWLSRGSANLFGDWTPRRGRRHRQCHREGSAQGLQGAAGSASSRIPALLRACGERPGSLEATGTGPGSSGDLTGPHAAVVTRRPYCWRQTRRSGARLAVAALGGGWRGAIARGLVKVARRHCGWWGRAASRGHAALARL